MPLDATPPPEEGSRVAPFAEALIQAIKDWRTSTRHAAERAVPPVRTDWLETTECSVVLDGYAVYATRFWLARQTLTAAAMPFGSLTADELSACIAVARGDEAMMTSLNAVATEFGLDAEAFHRTLFSLAGPDSEGPALHRPPDVDPYFFTKAVIQLHFIVGSIILTLLGNDTDAECLPSATESVLASLADSLRRRADPSTPRYLPLSLGRLDVLGLELDRHSKALSAALSSLPPEVSAMSHAVHRVSHGVARVIRDWCNELDRLHVIRGSDCGEAELRVRTVASAFVVAHIQRWRRVDLRHIAERARETFTEGVACLICLRPGVDPVGFETLYKDSVAIHEPFVDRKFSRDAAGILNDAGLLGSDALDKHLAPSEMLSASVPFLEFGARRLICEAFGDLEGAARFGRSYGSYITKLLEDLQHPDYVERWKNLTSSEDFTRLVLQVRKEQNFGIKDDVF